MRELVDARHDTQRAVEMVRAAWSDAPVHVRAMVKFLFEPMLVALEKTNDELALLHADEFAGFDFDLKHGAPDAVSSGNSEG